MSKTINFDDTQTFEVNFVEEAIIVNQVDCINVYENGVLRTRRAKSIDFVAGDDSIDITVTQSGLKTIVTITATSVRLTIWNFSENSNNFPTAVYEGQAYITEDAYNTGGNYIQDGTILIAKVAGANSINQFFYK